MEHVRVGEHEAGLLADAGAGLGIREQTRFVFTNPDMLGSDQLHATAEMVRSPSAPRTISAVACSWSEPRALVGVRYMAQAVGSAARADSTGSW
ncbi:hypothetical protein [Corynebacterium bouchesdurhonense]|uniref:hypothetical protein n=1 Tax=Corynebacterium bouchesdurhonense TaxID=1720192 RepID=UPI0037094909